MNDKEIVKGSLVHAVGEPHTEGTVLDADGVLTIVAWANGFVTRVPHGALKKVT